MRVFGSFVKTVLSRLGPFTVSRAFSWTGYTVPKYKWFKPSEVEGLDHEFVLKLDQAREIASFPFILTSGFRSPEKNKSVIGAVPDSSHLKGLAVDIRVTSSRQVALILDAAKKVGIDRRGIYVNTFFSPTHVHIDTDPEKAGNVIFIKQEGA